MLLVKIKQIRLGMMTFTELLWCHLSPMRIVSVTIQPSLPHISDSNTENNVLPCTNNPFIFLQLFTKVGIWVDNRSTFLYKAQCHIQIPFLLFHQIGNNLLYIQTDHDHPGADTNAYTVDADRLIPILQ